VIPNEGQHCRPTPWCQCGYYVLGHAGGVVATRSSAGNYGHGYVLWLIRPAAYSGGVDPGPRCGFPASRLQRQVAAAGQRAPALPVGGQFHLSMPPVVQVSTMPSASAPDGHQFPART